MSPRRPGLRSPPPRPVSPHRFPGVYDELLSPHRRNVEPPYGARYGPTPNYPPMGVKPVPLVNIPMQPDQPSGYRGRYDVPPFEDTPPGVEPPVPGFEQPQFEKPFGPPGLMDRERLPPSNFRELYRPAQYNEGPGYRDTPIPSILNEIPVHLGEQPPPRFRENYRQGPPYRDSVTYRDGQQYRESGPQGPYRDPNFRNGPPPFRDGSYRNVPFRDNAFRDNPPHGNFRDGNIPYRPSSSDPREAIPTNLPENSNYRDNYREDIAVPREQLRENMRLGYNRHNVRNKGGPRRNPNNIEHERHGGDKETRDRERYNEVREPNDKPERTRDSERGREHERVRDPERRVGYDKNRDIREGREDRPRDHTRNREHEKDSEKVSPDKKIRISPKRSKEGRDKKRSESRGRSRDRDRDRESRRDKKDEKAGDKSSGDRSREHKDKDKEKKIKERKKKKREKEKEIEKKKKREKKEKKEKETEKHVDDVEQSDIKPVERKTDDETALQKTESEMQLDLGTEIPNIEIKQEFIAIKQEFIPKTEPVDKPSDDLYGDEAAEAVDKEIIQNYIKTEENNSSADTTKVDEAPKEEPFDGIELQATAEELDLKSEVETSEPPTKEMLAPMPVLSKWEVDEEHIEKSREPGEITSQENEEDGKKVTSDVIKRAENAIFAKAINSLRPIEIKKGSTDRLKYGEETKNTTNNLQGPIPSTESEQKTLECNDKKNRFSKTPPPKLSVKDRLGGKVEDIRRTKEHRVVHSTVERVKSRSKTPKKEQPYRRVTVERERSRKQDNIGRLEISSKSDRRIVSENIKTFDKYRPKETEKQSKEEKRKFDQRERGNDKCELKSTTTDRERKKSTLDEAHFEPDYDETLESENDTKEDSTKKRERSASSMGGNDVKKPKLDPETIKLDLTNVKKKPDTESESSSDSEYSSSSSSSDARKRKKKKKRSKKKKKRAASESESESDSSFDDHKKKKKKKKHKKKSSKKKKKSKHK